MRRAFQFFTVLILLALLVVPALAQDAEEAPVQASGLGGFMLIGGFAVIIAVGILLTQREASGDENDLV